MSLTASDSAPEQLAPTDAVETRLADTLLDPELCGRNDPLVARAERLARERFRGRAAEYDREARFPQEDFADLLEAGLNAPAVPSAHGGLGLGHAGGLYRLFLLTKVLAMADMSLARCWEGHVNAQLLLASLATPEQQARWFEGIVTRGELWAAWSGEPQAKKPGQARRYGTTVEELADGYVVDGTKVFATSAGNAQRAILLVNTAGPGGARHAQEDGAVLLLVCDLSDPSVSVDGSWWDPIGMRGTVSHLVRFDRTFIPRCDQLGAPGQYMRDAWQTRFTPHYAATFLGAAQAALEYTCEFVASQQRAGDPFVQQRVGAMAMDVESAHLWLRRVAELWESGRQAAARQAGNRTRYLVEHQAMRSVDHAIRTCGARSLNRPSHLEQVYRDLSFYVRHDNADHLLAAIGREVLGEAHDASFFRPR